MDKQSLNMHAADNDMSKWANVCLFGDGASACIVSTDNVNLPEVVFDLIDVEYKTDYSQWISRREDLPCPDDTPEQSPTGRRPSLVTKETGTRPVFYLNVEGPKHIKASLDHWIKYLKKTHAFTLHKANHVALHSPNPKVLNTIAKHYGVANKISHLPERVGNLGPASCVTNLHDRLYGNNGAAVPVVNGDKIFGFALGDGIGLTDGVFLLEARVTGPNDRVIAGTTSKHPHKSARASALLPVPCNVGWPNCFNVRRRKEGATASCPSTCFILTSHLSS